MGIRQMVFGLLLTGAASLTFMMTYTQKSITTRPQHREIQRATGLTYEVPSSLPKEIPDFVLDIMRNATNKGWRFNQTAITRLRSDLERECNTSTGFVLTRTNQPLNSSFKYFHGGKRRLMTPELFNFAPMKEALAGDIGRRTTLMVANGDSIRHKFGTKVSAKRFVHAVMSYGTDYSLLVNPFSSQTHTSHSLLVQDRLRTRTNHSVYHLHPAWLGRTNGFWQRRRVFGRDKSTGFKIASAALVFCDEVHLLGFWPYLVDLQGRKIPFHYYEKGKHGFSQRWHNMDSEFRRLFRLFGEGIINIVAGKCKKR
ncbi:hypothetical protein Bbelb_024090 [Branchiostoma belcheri]|nr:hypothetical protein Bbelb_024090 [Branchiostoma belcheri]